MLSQGTTRAKHGFTGIRILETVVVDLLLLLSLQTATLLIVSVQPF